MSDILLTDAPDITANEFLLARNCAELLHRHYPGYLWGVTVTQGVLDVRCLNLSGQWGFTIKHMEAFSASDLDRKVMLAGGEILERYKQRRGRLDEASILALPTDFTGRHRPES